MKIHFEFGIYDTFSILKFYFWIKSDKLKFELPYSNFKIKRFILSFKNIRYLKFKKYLRVLILGSILHTMVLQSLWLFRNTTPHVWTRASHTGAGNALPLPNHHCYTKVRNNRSVDKAGRNWKLYVR